MSSFRVEWPRPGLAHLVFDDPTRKVNVIDESAIPFYARNSFVPSPTDPRTFVLPLATARSAL